MDATRQYPERERDLADRRVVDALERGHRDEPEHELVVEPRRLRHAREREQEPRFGATPARECGEQQRPDGRKHGNHARRYATQIRKPFAWPRRPDEETKGEH